MEQQTAVEVREANKAHRANWEEWADTARQDVTGERNLFNTMAWARLKIKSWDAVLKEHTDRLAAHPLDALSWSGDFVQAAANYTAAYHLTELFDMGATQEDMHDEVLRSLLNKSNTATSRSTSAMSNLTDDAERVAWADVYRRLKGRF